MKTLTSLFIAAFVAGSALLHAQDPTPEEEPATQSSTEEPAHVADAEVAETAAGSTNTMETEAEVFGPPAPAEDTTAEGASAEENTFTFNYQAQVDSPVGTHLNGTVTYDPGKFSYKIQPRDGQGGFSFEGSFLQGYWFSPFMTIVRSGLLVLWVALGCATAAIFQPAIARTQNELLQSPGRCAALGFLWLISFWILLLFGVVMTLVLIGLPFILVVLVFDLALRVFGLTVTFAVVGEWVARRLNRPGVSIYAAVFIGACVLGLLRLIPVAGSFIWFAAALFGVGATLAARFGTSMNPPALGYPTAPVPMTPATA